MVNYFSLILNTIEKKMKDIEEKTNKIEEKKKLRRSKQVEKKNLFQSVVVQHLIWNLKFRKNKSY